MGEPAVRSWILAGDEPCEHCGQSYALELEVRCVVCDGPMCPFCVVRVRESARCPEHCEDD